MTSTAIPMPTAATREARDAVTISAIAWQPRRGMDVAEWLHQGKRLGAIGRGSAWWIGDWVNYGNTKFGEKYTRAARITGYDSQSLMNMAYVASRIDISRRREELSWSHHAEVAALPTDEQEYWLRATKDDGLSVHRLREKLRALRAAASTQNGERSSDELDEPQSDIKEKHAETEYSREPAVEVQNLSGSAQTVHTDSVISHSDVELPMGDDNRIVCPRCGYGS
jgi:uncharacterized Zn-finger protein